MTTSTTLPGAVEILSAHFLTEWASRTLVALENENFSDQALPWVRFSVQQTGGGQETQGPKPHRKYWRTFSAFVQVFTPADRGVAYGLGFAQQAQAILEGERLSDGVVLFDAVIRAQPDEPRWKVHLVEVEGAFEEVK